MMEMIPFYLIFPNVVGFWVGEGETFKENMFLAPGEYLSFTYFPLQFIPPPPKKKKCEYHSMQNE